MPSLLRELAVAGSHKSDGSANASGKVFLYMPGTTTIVPGYKDNTLNEAWTTDGGGIPLDAGGRVKIWLNDPVTVVISDSDDAIVDTMETYNVVRAEQVEVENDNFTGAITDPSGAVSQGLGGKTDLDTVLTSAALSLGPDFQYQESAGATPRSYIEVITGLRVSVKDFGAVGNNIADDTTALQRALDEAKRLGATLIVEQGTYLHSNTLTLTSAGGVRIEGRGAASLLCTNLAVNCFEMTSCSSCSITNLAISSQAGSTGTGLVVTSGSAITLENVYGTSSTNIGIDLVTSSTVNVRDCFLRGGAGAPGRALRSSSTGVFINGGQMISGTGAAIEFTGAAANSTVIAVDFGGAGASVTGVLFTATLSGRGFDIIGCPTLGGQTTSIDASAAPIWPSIRHFGCGVTPLSLTFATGTTQTPVIKLGTEIRLTANAGGAGTVTIADPALLPTGLTDANELYFDFIFKNAAGGAVTWDFTAVGTVYILAAAVPTTAAHTIAVRFRWDPTTGDLREMSRADTAT